ncbi:MAG: bifunctional methylenetetrahydrofolate dehydrogenase/methenyltetrahydrofolate cyclohydrolase FolD [Deltaproteobacteria bacterium]
MAIIMDGNGLSRDIRNQVKTEALLLKDRKGIVPGLAVILVGENAASEIYVKRKESACNEVGFLSREFRLPHDTAQEEVLQIIRDLNHDQSIHGILVQLPLPGHINPDTVIETIDPRKDVDGFHPWNMGRLITGNPCHVACTPRGIVEMIDRHGIGIEGKEAVIVGRSNIVGKPLALLLLNRHATVTICHSRTKNLPEVTKRADILIAAAGRPEMIKSGMIKDGAVVIDVGINRLDNGRLVGDVAFAEVAEKASHITPVPGGVGPMTIAMLLVNTLKAASL